MLAIVQEKYGSTDALALKDIAQPTIGDDDVLVRVRASGVHMGDWHVMTGLPYMLRVVGFGLTAPKAKVRGIDVAGTIEAVGKNVTRLQAGDDVFGTCEGAFAEYASAPADNFALKPTNLTFEEAAAIPTSGFAALQALRDHGQVQPGQKVLIIGASGGVGLFAVQIAKSFGAEVTGVCSTSKVDLVRSVGADHIIDYTREDCTSQGQYDVVLDLGGNRSLADLRGALTPGGTLVLAGGEGGSQLLGGTNRWLQAAALSSFVRQQLRTLSTKPNQADLQVLREFAEAGTIRPMIDRTYPLRDVPTAMRYMREGQAHGKLAITV